MFCNLKICKMIFIPVFSIESSIIFHFYNIIMIHIREFITKYVRYVDWNSKTLECLIYFFVFIIRLIYQFQYYITNSRCSSSFIIRNIYSILIYWKSPCNICIKETFICHFFPPLLYLLLVIFSPSFELFL